MRRAAFASAWLALALALPAPRVVAQSRPLRRWDVAEGLVHSRVTAIREDRRGFLWVGTWDGLARFDGAAFASYGPADGLAVPIVNAIAEDARGDPWIATQGGGVARFLDDPAEAAALAARGRLARASDCFVTIRPEATRAGGVVDAIAFDREGRLWCGGEAGLHVARDPRADEPVFERVLAPSSPPESDGWRAAARAGEDPWFARGDTLLALEDGSPRAFEPPAPMRGRRVRALAPVDGARVRVAFDDAVWELEREGATWTRLVGPLGAARVRAVAVGDDGTTWVATSEGLLALRGARLERIGVEDGLADRDLTSLACDRAGDLWIGTWSAGLQALAARGVASWTACEGEPLRNVMRLVEDGEGRIVASTDRAGLLEIEGGRARWIARSRAEPFLDVHARLLRDRAGTWWVGTSAGLWRFDEPRLALEHGRRLGVADGAPEAAVFGALREDREGRIWFGSFDGDLWACEPRSTKFERVALGELGFAPPRVVRDDGAGSLWIAPFVGVLRRRDGRIEPLEGCEGLPDPQSRDLELDAEGALWVATRLRGVARTDEPSAARPRFRRWTSADGLPSDAVWSLACDARGRAWAATARGLARIDPALGVDRTLGVADGLAGPQANHVLIARDGSLWAATSGGISRVEAGEPGRTRIAVGARLARVAVAGVELALPRLGARRFDAGVLAAEDASLRVELLAPAGARAHEVSFQHRLGADGAWSEPRAERVLRWDRLASGAGTLAVRAVARDGTPLGGAAELAFVVPRPWWRRPGSAALVVAVLAAAAWLAHRARVRRLEALERVRREIAADLHDDLGAGLAQIAVLSEVARREAPAAARARLGEVAVLARSLRESMGDLVWAIDPREDRLEGLVRRLRQVAHDLFEAQGREVEFRCDLAAGGDRALAPDVRRHLHLFAKEALANAARHARAGRVVVEVSDGPGGLRLAVEDDGAGFDPAAVARGRGLDGLERRARTIGGALAIDSVAGRGTRVELVVPP